tara:strand:+ start:2674 stop:2856 length:183 start_codon:yes stop_codon:yes gene_type:complete
MNAQLNIDKRKEKIVAPVRRNFIGKLNKKVINVIKNSITPIIPNIFGEDSNSSKKDIYWL